VDASSDEKDALQQMDTERRTTSAAKRVCMKRNGKESQKTQWGTQKRWEWA